MRQLTRRASLYTTAAVALFGASRLSAEEMQPMQMAAVAASGDSVVAPGVTMRRYGESPSLIPGFARVQLVDFIMQPGSSTPSSDPGMDSAMICHVLDGELRIVQDGKTFAAPKNHVWTCNVGTKERAFNDGSAAATMRMTFLIAK